jgi:hypothetical protein
MRIQQLQWLAPAPMEGVSNVRISFLTRKLPDNTVCFCPVTFLTVRFNSGPSNAVAVTVESIQKIAVSTGKPGYFAIAVSHEQNRRIVGWSGPNSSAEAAADEAIAKCKERGGTDPHNKAQWHDYYHSFDKHVYDFGLEEPHEPAANAQAVVGKIRKRLGVNCPVWNEILRVRAGRRLRN